MKKKSIFILGIIFGALVFGTIGVFASQVLSKDISYTKKDGTVTNVDDALNELYTRSSECVSGTFEHEANTQWNIPIGFKASNISISYKISPYIFFVSANLNAQNDFFLTYRDSKEMAFVSCGQFITNDTTLTTNFPTVWGMYKNSYTAYYVACK